MPSSVTARVIVKLSPSTSLSLASTSINIDDASSTIEALSGVAIGASFIGIIVSLTVAVLDCGVSSAIPSEIV